jgi:hypothetical protein
LSARPDFQALTHQKRANSGTSVKLERELLDCLAKRIVEERAHYAIPTGLFASRTALRRWLDQLAQARPDVSSLVQVKSDRGRRPGKKKALGSLKTRVNEEK